MMRLPVSSCASAPRVERVLLEGAAALDDASVPVAETYRRLRELAAVMGVPRPSYERVRLHLRQVRSGDLKRAEARKLLVQLAFNTRAADAVIADLLELVEPQPQVPSCKL